MIVYKQGNILEAQVEALVNPINCMGVMGAGLALQFKQAYPDMFHCYKTACDYETVVPCRMLLYCIPNGTLPKYIIGFPTKRHWKDPSRIGYIQSGLRELVNTVKSCDIKSIAIPPLGCGLGGLKLEAVGPLIVSAFSELPDVEVHLYGAGF